MYVDFEKLSDGWTSIGVGLTMSDVTRLIALLQSIDGDEDQHFHVTLELSDEKTLDFEVYSDRKQAKGNVAICGLAIEPDDG